jgi:hypothetical protein
VGENTNIKKNAETSLDASKEVGIEVNQVMSSHIARIWEKSTA